LGEAYILTLVRLFGNSEGEPPAAEQVAAALKEQLSKQAASK
jgi:hypothetical protein